MSDLPPSRGNLPPGCRECDIPGNRPEDEAWDKFWEDDSGSIKEALMILLQEEEIDWYEDIYENYAGVKQKIDELFEGWMIGRDWDYACDYFTDDFPAQEIDTILDIISEEIDSGGVSVDSLYSDNGSFSGKVDRMFEAYMEGE